MADKARARLRLCTACAGASFAQIATITAALAEAGLAQAISVVGTDCMDACDAPVALALQAEERATYLFAGVVPDADLGDIVATCRAYLEAPEGWIEDARPCGRLRHCLRARVPAAGQAAG